jgi:hypothetical protein
VTAYASSTARTAFTGIPNHSVVGPRSRSKSTEDSAPCVRIRSRTRSATSAFSSWTCRALRNHGNSLAEGRGCGRRPRGLGPPSSFTDTRHVRFVGQGPDNDFVIAETVHVTVNADGVVTAEHQDLRIECT